jgi:hypothetical protein
LSEIKCRELPLLLSGERAAERGESQQLKDEPGCVSKLPAILQRRPYRRSRVRRCLERSSNLHVDRFHRREPDDESAEQKHGTDERPGERRTASTDEPY